MSDRFRQLGEGEMYGAGGQKRVPAEFILNYAIALPPPAEQAAIAAYLDRETAQIDALVARLEQLVALLHEKRQALISHAVTKGLDPAAPMKPSGVEWLGEVPAHWEVAGLTKFLESVVDYRGRTPAKTEQGTYLVTARNIKAGRIDYEVSEEYVDPYEGSLIMRRGQPKIGDVLFTTEAPLGEAANVDREDIALAQRVIKFRGIAGVLDNYFPKYWILADYFQHVLATLATGSTALGLKASKLPELRVLLPSYEEQGRIVSNLNNAMEQVLSATVSALALAEAMRERRAALITAAVTGQIDVRGLV
jgi:type I restriction enzyme S subunit